MDDKDRMILQALIKDGRAKLNDIARDVELPVTTVYNRMRKMSDEGLFAVRAELNRKKLGYGLEFFVLVGLDTSSVHVDQEKLARQMVGIRNVVSADIVTGSKDIIVRATARDMDELTEVVLKKLRGLDGVASTETLVVMKGVRGSEEKLL